MSTLTMVQPFQAAEGGTNTQRLTAGVASSRVAFQPTTKTRTRARSARVVNLGASVAYVEFGDSTVVATVPVAGGAAGSYPVLPNTVEVFDGISATNMAAITASATADLYVTPGEGA